MVVGVLYYHFLDTQTLSSHEKINNFIRMGTGSC